MAIFFIIKSYNYYQIIPFFITILSFDCKKISNILYMNHVKFYFIPTVLVDFLHLVRNFFISRYASLKNKTA